MRLSNFVPAAAALLVAGWFGAAVAHADPEPTPAPAPEAAEGIDGTGTYKVGTDIMPGTYLSAGPKPDQVCYWKRVNADGIVDNAMTKKPQAVTIEAGDTEFVSTDCQNWQLTDCATGCPGDAPRGDVLGGLLNIIGRAATAPQ